MSGEAACAVGLLYSALMFDASVVGRMLQRVCRRFEPWGGPKVPSSTRLESGRSNLVDPAEWPKIGLLNRDFGSILSVFPRKNSKTQSSLNFLQSGPLKFTKSDFSGLAPIRRVLKVRHPQKHYIHKKLFSELFLLLSGYAYNYHRVLQGAAQRGAQFYFIFSVLRTLFSCSEMSLFSLKSCTPLKATP